VRQGPGLCLCRRNMADESIYNLIPQPVPVPEKPPMYRSKHDGKVPPTFSTFGVTNTSKPGYTNLSGHVTKQKEGHHEYGKVHATMGKDGNAIPPSSMLKKNTGGGGGPCAATPMEVPSNAAPFKYTDTHRQPVPTKDELKVLAKKSYDMQASKKDKNFITANAVENILAVPKRQPEPADWLKKPHFGTVPPYLQKIKAEIKDEYEYIRSMSQQMENSAPPGMRLLPEEERLMLIDQLKEKWDGVNSTYQQSSVLSLASLDTIGKVKRKEMYEAQLAQIEKDIEKLSKKYVYVQDDE